MPEQTERRVAPRFKMQAPVEYRGQAAQGNGMTWDISSSGLRVDDASTRLDPGELARLRCSFFVGSFDVELVGNVVRHTNTGFAVQFRDLGAAQLKLLHSILPAGLPN